MLVKLQAILAFVTFLVRGQWTTDDELLDELNRTRAILGREPIKGDCRDLGPSPTNLDQKLTKLFER